MKYDVIIVLAGGIQDDGSLPSSVKRRINRAKELFDKKLAPYIIMSGRWSAYREKHKQPPETEAEAMRKYAQEIGLPAGVLLKEEKSNNTISNVQHTLEDFLIPNNWKKIIVVTSDFHINRTRFIFDSLLTNDFHVCYQAASTDSNYWKRLLWKVKEITVLGKTKQLLSNLRAVKK